MFVVYVIDVSSIIFCFYKILVLENFLNDKYMFNKLVEIRFF